MSTTKQATGQTKTAGAIKGGGGKFIFPPEQLCGPGTLLYFPADIVHYTIATEDEDVVFFAVKDLSHGINGIPVDPSRGVYTGRK